MIPHDSPYWGQDAASEPGPVTECPDPDCMGACCDDCGDCYRCGCCTCPDGYEVPEPREPDYSEVPL